MAVRSEACNLLWLSSHLHEIGQSVVTISSASLSKYHQNCWICTMNLKITVDDNPDEHNQKKKKKKEL